MKEFTTNDIVKNATDGQLDKLFKLAYEISDIIEDIASGYGELVFYVERLAYCPDYAKNEMLKMAATAEMSNRQKEQQKKAKLENEGCILSIDDAETGVYKSVCKYDGRTTYGTLDDLLDYYGLNEE